MDDLVFGLVITGLGMGLVFGLLVLLWGALALFGRLDAAVAAAEERHGEGARAATGRTGAAVLVQAHALEPEALAAVAIAVAQHAALLRREAAPAQRSAQPGTQMYASRWLAAGRTRQTRSFRNRGR